MIERAKKEDLEQIFEISNNFFDWTLNQLKECLTDESMIFLVQKYKKNVQGFLIAQNLVDTINILLIATKKQWQNKGVASGLIKELEKIAKEQNQEKIWLEVKDGNTYAIKFYEKNNFKYLTTRKHYYSTGQDALIYEKNTF